MQTPASISRHPVHPMLIVVALYAVNIWLRFSDPASLAIAIVLSAIGLGMLAVTSWLGDEPVRVHKE